MSDRLRKLRGEKSDGGFWSRNGQTSLNCPGIPQYLMNKQKGPQPSDQRWSREKDTVKSPA